MAATSPDPAARVPATGIPPRGSLAEGLRGHSNSFGLLRLILASSVIFSHAFYIGGWGEDPTHEWTHGQETIGGFAVVGFFVISGYLIAKSGAGNDIMQFLWRRVLRIFPAFWLVLIVAAVVVGPIFWVASGHPLGAYVTTQGAGPLGYLILNSDLTIRHYGIYDIFATTTPYGDYTGGVSVFNGSLWTLAYEWTCYLVIAAFVVLGILRRARFLVPVAAGFFYVLIVFGRFIPGGPGAIHPRLGDPFTLRLTLIFLIGSTMAMYARRIPLRDWLGVVGWVVAVTTLFTHGWVPIGYPAFAYALLWTAARLPERFRRIGAKNDYSYGMYVYGFLVQQATAYLAWYRLGYVPWVIICLAITAACAYASWHLVEKRALALKDWGPGRGLRYWWSRRPGGVASSTRGAHA